MRSNQAFIIVTCDKCNTVKYISLTSTAGGSYNERNVDEDLKRLGWTVENGDDICEGCNETD